MLYLLACWAFHTNLLFVVPCVVLVLTWLVSTLSASRSAVEFSHVQTRLTKALRKSRLSERMTPLLSMHSAPSGKRNSSLRPWRAALRKLSILYLVWTATANSMIHHTTRRKRPPPAHPATNHTGRIPQDRPLRGLPGFGADQSFPRCGDSA